MSQVQQVKQAYLADFEAFSGNGASSGSRWLSELRNQAIRRFDEVGFPGRREERWRFTNVSHLAETRYARPRQADAAAPSPAQLGGFVLGPDTAHLLALVNGRFAPELSSLAGLPDGVVAQSLLEAVESHPQLVERHLGKHASVSASPFTALSTAFLEDGAFIYVPPDVVVDKPIQILFLTQSGNQRIVAYPRSLLVVDRGGSATVVETFVGLDDGPYWNNVVGEAVLEENAQLKLYRVQREGEYCHHTSTSESYQGRDSQFTFVTVELGSAMTRHDVNAVLDGTGAECSLYGLSQLHGKQHVDHHTMIDHAQPHCNSWEYFNGIYDDRSRGVFTGRIVVRPGAQRTDSKQTNNNLLLSARARADSQPQLEIYADDVRCTHGATLGPIDERALFYMQTRGLSADAARSLLTYGFGVEILNKIDVAELRDQLDAVLHERLGDQGGARNLGS